MSKSELNLLAKYTPLNILIQGEVSFSHIATMYDGPELIEANRKAVERGGSPSLRPYCTISIDNPRILNQETLPPEVVSVMTKRISTKEGRSRYYATSKSPNLPPVVYSALAGDGYSGHGIADANHPLPHELATGLKVTIVAKLFNTKMGVGCGIDGILVDEPVRYYEPNSIASILGLQGVSYVAPVANTNNVVAMDRNSIYPSVQSAAIPVNQTNNMRQMEYARQYATPYMAQATPMENMNAKMEGFMPVSDDMELPFSEPSSYVPAQPVEMQTTAPRQHSCSYVNQSYTADNEFMYIPTEGNTALQPSYVQTPQPKGQIKPGLSY